MFWNFAIVFEFLAHLVRKQLAICKALCKFAVVKPFLPVCVAFDRQCIVFLVFLSFPSRLVLRLVQLLLLGLNLTKHWNIRALKCFSAHVNGNVLLPRGTFFAVKSETQYYLAHVDVCYKPLRNFLFMRSPTDVVDLKQRRPVADGFRRLRRGRSTWFVWPDHPRWWQAGNFSWQQRSSWPSNRFADQLTAARLLQSVIQVHFQCIIIKHKG